MSKKGHSLIKKVAPKLNKGRYVFITEQNPENIDYSEVLCHFKEQEGTTAIMEKKKADQMGYSYSFVAAWITLTVHSSLEAVGLTARVSNALANECISCNAVAAYHHDHIFVPYKLADRAINVLRKLD
ncbi:MAG: ACT domain-containing protein [Bacteroidales bacterium]|jgi:hypothetical protein